MARCRIVRYGLPRVPEEELQLSPKAPCISFSVCRSSDPSSEANDPFSLHALRKRLKRSRKSASQPDVKELKRAEQGSSKTEDRPRPPDPLPMLRNMCRRLQYEHEALVEGVEMALDEAVFGKRQPTEEEILWEKCFSHGSSFAPGVVEIEPIPIDYEYEPFSPPQGLEEEEALWEKCFSHELSSAIPIVGQGILTYEEMGFFA